MGKSTREVVRACTHLAHEFFDFHLRVPAREWFGRHAQPHQATHVLGHERDGHGRILSIMRASQIHLNTHKRSNPSHLPYGIMVMTDLARDFLVDFSTYLVENFVECARMDTILRILGEKAADEQLIAVIFSHARRP